MMSLEVGLNIVSDTVPRAESRSRGCYSGFTIGLRVASAVMNLYVGSIFTAGSASPVRLGGAEPDLMQTCVHTHDDKAVYSCCLSWLFACCL